MLEGFSGGIEEIIQGWAGQRAKNLQEGTEQNGFGEAVNSFGDYFFSKQAMQEGAIGFAVGQTMAVGSMLNTTPDTDKQIHTIMSSLAVGGEVQARKVLQLMKDNGAISDIEFTEYNNLIDYTLSGIASTETIPVSDDIKASLVNKYAGIFKARALMTEDENDLASQAAKELVAEKEKEIKEILKGTAPVYLIFPQGSDIPVVSTKEQVEQILLKNPNALDFFDIKSINDQVTQAKIDDAKGLLNKTKQAETTTDGKGRTKEAVSAGTDVLETGVGMAAEPGKERVAGEDIQAEEVLEPAKTSENISTAADSKGVYIKDGEYGFIRTEGQLVVFETNDKIIDLGNKDELAETPISEFGIEKEELLDVQVNEDNSVVVEGVKFVNNFSNPQAAINTDADGNVVSVNLETEDGKKRTIRGQRAEEIAYQYKLKEFEQNATEESIARLEQEVTNLEGKAEKAKSQTKKRSTAKRKPKEVVSEKVTEVTAPAIEATPQAGSVGVGGEVEVRVSVNQKNGVGEKLQDGEKRYDIIKDGIIEGDIIVADKKELGHYEVVRSNVKNQNKGIGTKAYKKLIATLDKPLHSDMARTPQAERLWAKLEKEGLAKKSKDGIVYESLPKEQSLKETPTAETKSTELAAKAEPTKEAAKTEAKKSKPEQIGNGLLDLLGLEPVEPTTPAKKAGKKKAVNVSNKSELSELEGKAQGDKKTIIEAAKKAIATLKSVFPDMEIYIHEDTESYNETMSEVGGVANSRGNFAFERDANNNPTGRGRIDINLSNAKDTTVAHEVVHAVLLKAFGDNPALFKAFRDRMSKILRADLNEQVTAFEKLYAGQDVAPEEYLTELAALLSQGGETVEYKPSTLRKVAALINEFVSRITKGKFQPFKSEVDFINFVGFLNQISGAISEGGVIEQLNTQQAYSDGRAIQVPADFKAVKYKSEKVSKSQIGDYTFPSNIEILKISNLPIKTLEEAVKQYKGRVVIITSDATGYGVDSDGEPILGGAGFASNKINVNDGIGFASLNEGTVKGTYTRAEKAYGFGKVLVLIMVQPPHTTINNSYGAKYMLRGLLKIGELNATELEKTKNAIKNFVIKSKSVQEEFKSEAKKARDAEELKQAEIEINKLKKLKENGKVLTKEQNAAIKKYDAKIKKKEAEGKVEEVTKQRATQKALFELLDKIQPGADLNSLIKEFLNITTFTLRKEIGLGILPSSKETRTDKRTTYSKIAFNNINYSIYDFLKEYGDKTILTEDMMLNNKGGVLVGGFELDVTEVEQREKLIKEIQSKGILHPLFNAKLPGKNHFRLDDLYGAQENFGKFAVPDKVIDEDKIGEDELGDLVRKIFTSNSDYEPKFRSIPLNERTYTHLKIANKTKFKDEVLAPKGFLKEKEADVATKVAKGEGFIPLPGAAEQMAEATMVSKSQRVDNASEKLKELFQRDNIPLTITEAKVIVEEVYDWTSWYDGLSAYVFEIFGEYSEDILSMLPLASMAANSSATVGLAINNAEKIYRGEKPSGVAEYYGYVTDFLEGKGIKSDKMSEFFKALTGNKDAIAVDMHVYSIIMGKNPNKKQVNPKNKQEFDNAKEFVRTLASELDLAPREVQAALWAANILRTGGRPDSYEQYFKKQIDEKGLKERIENWRNEGYKPFSEIRKDAEASAQKEGATIKSKSQVDVYHGSPYDFDKFTTEKIGTGEGAQAFGWGLYFTDIKSIAEGYADIITKRKRKDKAIPLPRPEYIGSEINDIIKNKKTVDKKQFDEILNREKNRVSDEIKKSDDFNYKYDMNEYLSSLNNVSSLEDIRESKKVYQVSLHEGKTPDQYTWLEWDKPVSENNVKKIVNALYNKLDVKYDPNDDMGIYYDVTYPDGGRDAATSENSLKGRIKSRVLDDNKIGRDIYNSLVKFFKSDKQASLFLLENGIDGVKYPAESISRGATSDTARGFNYVVFDENAVTIKSKAQKAQNDKIKDFIDAQRKAGQSDKDIKAGLELVADKVGLTTEDIDNLMGVESDEAKPKKGYTPKKKKVEPAQEPEVKEQKERAFATEAERRTGDKTTEIPDSLKFYTPTSEEEQTKIAQDFIKEVGVDEAITYFTIPSKRIEINPQNLPVLASELLDILYAKQASASETEAKQIADNVHDILEATVVAAGNAATLLSMMRKFYNSNPYNFLAQVTRLLELNNKPIADKIGTAIININNINKAVAGEVANNVVKEIVSTRAASAKEKFERSKANLKALWKKSFNIGIASNQYEAAKNDIQFVKALAVMAKDFVVYQSVEFSEFIKEVASQIGLQESDIDQDHLRKIFEKAKSEKIQEGIKVSLKELELKLKDLIESHYSSPNSIADDLVNKLKDQFGLSDTDAKKVEEAIRQEIKVLTAQEKIKALKAEGIKDKKYIDEILALSEQGLLNVNSIIEKLGAKLGIQKLTKEETDKLVELAKQIKEAKEDRIKARNVQKFEDYKFVLSKKFNLSDFLVSNYLTNIFGSLRSNLANIAGNVSETNLLVSEIVTNALLKGNPKDALLGIEALIRGTVRGFDFTKEVLTTGVSSYKELGDIRARGMWELIMDRKVDLTKTERVLQYLLSIPYVGEAALTERRFWNRALLSMDSLSGTTNAELGALWAATKEADNRKLKGQARANFIAELMASTPELKAEAQMYAAQLGYKPGSSESKRAVTNYLVSKRPAPIKKISSEYSARATLTQQPSPNTLTGMIAIAMNNAIGKNQKLKFIFPVVNTFANLIVKNIERSPFEFLSLGLDVLRAQSENKTIGRDVLTQEEVARRIKTATVWTAIAVLLFMAAGGMGDDDEEGLEIYGSGTGNAALDKQRRSLGWKPNTIRFGKDGGYYNFEYLPFGFMLSMVGNMRDYFKYKDESGLAIRKAQSKRLFNKTYDSLTSAEKAKLEAELMSGKYNLPDVENKELGNLWWNIIKTPGTYTLQLFKSLGDLIGVMGDKSKWENVASFLGNIGRGVAAPRYGGEIRDITDNKLYDTKEFRNMLAANVPGVTLGNVRLDAFGREIEKYKSESFWSGVKYAFTSRFYNPPTVTPIDQFLWENRIVVNMPDNPPSLAYNDDVFRAYLVKRGDILLNKIWNAMKEKKFQKIDNSGKVVKFTPQQNLEVINKYVSQSNDEAKKFIDELLKKAKKLY